MKGKYHINYIISLFILMGILVLANSLSARYFLRWDLTEDKVFSLSKATREILKRLDDPIIIKAFFSKNLPHPYNNASRTLKDQLEEFRTYSRGKLTYQFIDPAEDKEEERKVMLMGIPPLQLTVIESDKLEIKKGYMGLAIFFEDKKDVIPLVKSTMGLEYDIVTKVKKLTSKQRKRIGFTAGRGEPELDQGLTTIKSFLIEQYDVERVVLENEKSTPADIDALIIVGPQQELSDKELYFIDQFIMKGKPAAFLLDKVGTDLQTLQARLLNTKLEDLLENFGVKLSHSLIHDPVCQRISVQQTQGFFTIQNLLNYPLFPLARTFDKSHPMVKDLEALYFPFASPLELKDKDNLKPLGIVKSSSMSWEGKEPFDLNPLQRFHPTPESRKGPFEIVAVVTGSFKSFFVDKPIPIKKEEKEKKEEPVNESKVGRIVVVGDSDFIKDEYVRDKINMTFFMNMVDWLVQDEELTALRSREVTDRSLKEVSKTSKKWIKFGNIFATPILLILFGIVRWRIRLRKKEKIDLMF